MTTRIITDPDTRVLVVDDNPQYGMLLTRILSGALGYTQITVVQSLEEAFALYEQGSDPGHELIFVDYNFPEGRTGAEFLRFLDSRGLSRGKAVFLITAEPTVENQREALDAGAAGVVVKPFDRSMLQRQLDKAQQLLRAETHDTF